MIRYASPEETGIRSEHVIKLLQRLEDKGIPMHSIIIMHKDRVILEHYYAPYKAGDLHRMFSITKSFTALAVSILISEGTISLSDRICGFFPEYTDNVTHKWILDMTVENLLTMRTCYAGSTYNVHMTEGWVKSFFTSKPSHKPGTVFHYDTSAAHVLTALVEKLSGMSLLDFLYEKVLRYIGFSENAYIIKDPEGISMGGSGLMCTPMDVLKVLRLFTDGGRAECTDGISRQLISEEFLSKATADLSDTIMTAPVRSEAQGYGMQVWRNEKGGNVLYGMGGQLAISLPEQELLIVTTADTQNIAGGNQLIYDSIYEELLPYTDEDHSAGINADNAPCDTTSYNYRDLIGAFALSAPKQVYSVKDISETYVLYSNKSDFEKLRITASNANNDGEVTFIRKNHSELTFRFGFGHLILGLDPERNEPCAGGAAWLRDNVLYIKIHLLGECVGSIMMEIYFENNDAVVYSRKVEETYYQDYDGHFYGERL